MVFEFTLTSYGSSDYVSRSNVAAGARTEEDMEVFTYMGLCADM